MPMKRIGIILTAAACVAFSACAAKPTHKGQSQPASSPAFEAEVSRAASEVSGTASSEAASSAASSAAPSSEPAASSTVPSSAASAAQPKPAATVTVPYGYSLSQIGDAMQAAGICGKTDLLAAANSYNATAFSVASSIPSDPHRVYRLEGYLYPDTYQFYKSSAASDVIQKMLHNAQSKIGGNYSYAGMTTDQVITLASIIQKEAKTADDMKKVSSVYHNRLNAQMKLQADPTIYYIENYVKPNLPAGEKDSYNSYYNTYKCPALPAGPICSPGANALYAAAHPDATGYMYFVYDQKNSQMYYAQTFDEHKANCVKAGVAAPSQP